MKVKVEAMGEATSLADRKRRAGQRLMIGLLGPSVDADFRKLVAEVKPMGFVLFARNMVEHAQARELCRELESLASPHDPVLIATDHEGGRVVRLPEPAVRWPSMRTLGAAENFTAKVGLAMGKELRALGLHLNLAPVADLDRGGDSGIGDRSFGAEPKPVVGHVVAMLEGLRAAGVQGCVKHFPGLGAAVTDSHRVLPVIERDLPELREYDLAPFAAAIRAGAEVVMVGHAVYPVWDEEFPATLSRKIVPGVLRKELGFSGVVLSDDLEMRAVSGYTPYERAMLASHAGIDVLMSCDDLETQHALFRAMVLSQEEELLLEKRAIDSVARVERLREATLKMDTVATDPSVVDTVSHRALAQLVRARGE